MQNLEAMQRQAQEVYGLDAQGALRAASGLSLDTQGVLVQFPDWASLIGDKVSTLADGQALTQQVATVDSTYTVSGPTLDSGGRLCWHGSGPAANYNNRRDFFLSSQTVTDVRFKFTCDPAGIGNVTGGTVAPQGGVCLRYKSQGGKLRAVTINNNIIFGLPYLNVGVWEFNADGSGFNNRQGAVDITGLWPNFTCEGTLIGNVVTVSAYAIGAGPSTWTTINLDTQAPDADGATAIPTPTGSGQVGAIVAHTSGLTLGDVRLKDLIFSKRS
jgi:hypothetical protein